MLQKSFVEFVICIHHHLHLFGSLFRFISRISLTAQSRLSKVQNVNPLSLTYSHSVKCRHDTREGHSFTSADTSTVLSSSLVQTLSFNFILFDFDYHRNEHAETS